MSTHSNKSKHDFFLLQEYRRYRRSLFMRILNYFLKGLLLVLPVVASSYIIYWLFKKIDSIFSFPIPGLGIVIIIVGICIIGYFANKFVSRPLFDLLDDLLSKTPLLKTFYNLFKDMTEAFVGDKKKFSQPVMVKISETGISRLGFVTQKDLDFLGLEGYMAVYFPDSYAISGQLVVVPNDCIQKIEANATHMMTFIISGGVKNIEDDEK